MKYENEFLRLPLKSSPDYICSAVRFKNHLSPIFSAFSYKSFIPVNSSNFSAKNMLTVIDLLALRPRV